MSNYALCMKERYGYEVIEHDYGFLTYRIEGEVCRAIEIFVPEENRGCGFWQMLWQELIGICVAAGVKRIIGFVDITKPEPETRLRAYMRFGAKLKGTENSVIIIEWSVPDGC